jgi:uncharacterized protein (TIGR02453 family)
MLAAMSKLPPELFRFLKELAKNNNRDWFQANKARYEEHLKEPALAFISAFGPKLEKISPHFVADPRPVGGSLFRIFRDTRFAKDKTPYKTNSGLHFRHETAKTAHAPGFYLHLEPKRCFAGVGIWHPDGDTARKVRTAIAEQPKAWKKAVGGKAFASRFALTGDSLKRPPAGFDPAHPCIEDIKRKDFIAVTELGEDEVVGPRFLDTFAAHCKAGAPLMEFLCKAVGVPF